MYSRTVDALKEVGAAARFAERIPETDDLRFPPPPPTDIVRNDDNKNK